MAQITEFSVSATPGMVHTFVDKMPTGLALAAVLTRTLSRRLELDVELTMTGSSSRELARTYRKDSTIK